MGTQAGVRTDHVIFRFFNIRMPISLAIHNLLVKVLLYYLNKMEYGNYFNDNIASPVINDDFGEI
jgi:hypothetical protein